MIDNIYNILAQLDVPVDNLHRPEFGNTGMSVSFHIFGEETSINEDGIPSEYEGSVQIDLFARHGINYSHLKKEIKTRMLLGGFIFEESHDTEEYVEGIGEIDHVVFIFNYIELED